MEPSLERYSRQVLFSEVGEQGQQRLMNSRVFVCGCGALGTVIAETLVRAGVGFLRIVDRDFVEISNLQRQVLFDERDVAQRIPKAIAAAEKLAKINSSVTLEPIVADVDHNNIRGFFEGVDLVLDATDNFEIRFLLNDASLETGIPWVYGGCIGSHGQTMAVFPHESACLRCVIESPPDPGMTETCDTAGVLGPAVNVVASLQSVAAIKILSGRRDAVEPALMVIDVWDGTLRKMSVRDLRERSQCPACVQGKREWLSGDRGAQSTVLCGRNAVQVVPHEKLSLSLEDLAKKVASVGTVTQNKYLLRLVLPETGHDITVFSDGRAIIKGTDDITAAKALYSRYIGH